MDKVSAEERSRVMRAVRRKHTAPEMKVRRLLHSEGYRYRLHDRRLAGSPDVVFKGRRKAIFVHGCFWHGHGCRASLSPRSRQEFWQPKLARNQARDEANVRILNEQGWKVLVVWECETSSKRCQELRERLLGFLGSRRL